MTEAEFFESKGLPYQMTSMSQMFGAIRTRGSKAAVMVETNTGNFYVGYYDFEEIENMLVKLRRVRRYPLRAIHAFRSESWPVDRF